MYNKTNGNLISVFLFHAAYDFLPVPVRFHVLQDTPADYILSNIIALAPVTAAVIWLGRTNISIAERDN